jgi:vacuolar-type H+-ATPase subunit I/STV1
MRSITNVIFFAMLLFVSCTTEYETSEMDLENVPAFLELSSHPVSQAFFSAVALKMKASAANGGFAKVMNLINELIHDNKNQIQRIRRIDSRVEGECLVTSHKLRDRGVFFAGQRSYFHARGAVSVEEKAEAINVMGSRNSQRTAYTALLAASRAAHERQEKKWTQRIQHAEAGVSKVNAALRAINEWTPKTNTAFVQQLVKETTEAYTQVKNYPLSIPSELVQLAANDHQIKKRLYEWLNMLKGSIVEALAGAQSARSEINALYNNLRSNIEKLNDLLQDDAKKLAAAIENYTTLIKVYDENEKIYTNLANQNSLLATANTKWCAQEKANYTVNHKSMEAQLKVFQELKQWLRKNFGRVRSWLRKRYASHQ